MSEKNYTHANIINIPPELVPIIEKYVFQFEELQYVPSIGRGKTFVRITIIHEVSDHANP